MSRGKRAEKTKHRPPWLLLGLLMVVAIAGLTAYRAGFLRGDAASEELRNRNERYTFENGSQQVYAPLNGGVAVASSTGLQILDKDGYTVARSVVSVATPALTVSDTSAALYDVGGTLLRVGDSEGNLTTIQVADRIISAGMNASGWLAVVTEETGYKGLVTVYNAEMEAVYKWHSGTNYVLSALVSPDCKTMAALTLEETGSAVHVFSLSSEEEYASYHAAGVLLFDFGFLGNDRLCAVHDGGLVFFTTTGSDGGAYSFDGTYLAGYSFDGDGFATLLLSQYLSGSAGNVVTVGYGGNVTGQLTPAESVQGLSVREKQVMLRYGEYTALYSQSLEEQNRFSGTQGAKYAVLTEKEKGFVLYSGYCEPMTF